MNTKEKRRFVRDLIGNVQSEILSKTDQMPEEWDGIELRRYVADKFENAVVHLQPGRVRYSGYSNRLKSYRNDVIVNNL